MTQSPSKPILLIGEALGSNEVWSSLDRQRRIEIIRLYNNQGKTQTEIAQLLQTTRENVRDFCRRWDVGVWSQGAQVGNKNAEVHGQGRNTILRLSQKVVQEHGKDPRVCERCGTRNPLHNHHIHHKDRDRTNNDISNLEILCPTCHNLEHENEHPRNKLGQYV